MTCVPLSYELETQCRDTIKTHALKESVLEFVRSAARERMDVLNGGETQ